MRAHFPQADKKPPTRCTATGSVADSQGAIQVVPITCGGPHDEERRESLPCILSRAATALAATLATATLLAATGATTFATATTRGARLSTVTRCRHCRSIQHTAAWRDWDVRCLWCGCGMPIHATLVHGRDWSSGGWHPRLSHGRANGGPRGLPASLSIGANLPVGLAERSSSKEV